MKSMIWEEVKDGKTIAVHEAYLCEPSRVASKKAEAKRNQDEIEKAEEERKLKEAQAEEEARALKEAEEKAEREKAYREAYYATWRIVLVCDSLLNDWQVGDEGIDEELAYACKIKALGGEGAEKLLTAYDQVRERFIKTFGEANL